MPLLLTLLLAVSVVAGTPDPLERGWARPPASTRPWCYWYWISDNISKEGITRDLEAMAQVGIGEAFIGNIHLEDVQPGAVKVLTEAWWGMVEHAIREGGRVGVDIGFFNCPGWSQSGGPWIKPEQSMRYLASSELRVTGPLRIQCELPKGLESRGGSSDTSLEASPEPDEICSLPPPLEPFQDVSLVAFPAPALDDDQAMEHHPRITTTPEVEGIERAFDNDWDTAFSLATSGGRNSQPRTVDFDFARAFTARSLVLHPAGSAFSVRGELQASIDGTRFRTVRSFTCDRSNTNLHVGPMPFGPLAVSFPATAARRFRLLFAQPEGPAAFAEIALSGAARLDRYVEKQLGKMHPTPQPEWDTYLWPPAAEADSPALAVAPDRVIDLSGRVGPDGTLTWDVPDGEWVILRTGMSPTGTRNAPASPEGQGLEVDKMNRAAAAAHFDAYLGKLLQRMPASDRKALKHVVADSYEMGSQNWTEGFGALFGRAYRYDPRPWLPALTGRIVGTAEQSDRFLWDLRRLVADRVAADYVGGLRDLCHRHGLRLWLENYGHWGFPAEFLQYGGQADQLGGEFWATGDLGSIELRAAASAAHLYGMPVVSAEAFTGGPLFRSAPWDLKRRGDWAATEGINHFVLHVNIHQPDERRPGINAWFGTEFNRHNTWFATSRPWVDYLRRTHFLLQQGQHVADVAYFIGEDTPKMTGRCEPSLPAGYDFDYVNAEAILRRFTVKDRRWVLPDGKSYGLLVLPPLNTMRPAVLRSLGELVADGGAILGAPPQRSPSLENYPACDREVRELAATIWRRSLESKTGEGRHGKGRVLHHLSLQDALDRLDIAPDVDGLEGSPVRWTHRHLEDADIYFLSNQSDQPVEVRPAFRMRQRLPELWYADSGAIEKPGVFECVGDETRVPLALEARGAVFVVFRERAPRRATVVALERRGSAASVPSSDATAAADEPVTGLPLPAPRLSREPDGKLRLRSCEPGGYWLTYSDDRQFGVVTSNLPGPVTLDGPWHVEFPPDAGLPGPVTFARLQSWATHADPRIQFYSGTATYRCEFAAPQGDSGHLWLDLGQVESIARVRINGREVGSLWKPPYRLLLVASELQPRNVLEVDVSNVWLNRLIGARRHPKGLPGAGESASQPYLAADVGAQLGDRLLPAGLIGPVRLIPVKELVLP